MGYTLWKQNQPHCRKPWRFVEDITVPRIEISECFDITSEPLLSETASAIPPRAKTPTAAQMKPHISSNGHRISRSENSSPITVVQKKSKKKFKFKFDK